MDKLEEVGRKQPDVGYWFFNQFKVGIIHILIMDVGFLEQMFKLKSYSNKGKI
jgi:hypothetical protein